MTRHPEPCARCRTDLALYGETFYDGGTGEHHDVRRMVRRYAPPHPTVAPDDAQRLILGAVRQEMETDPADYFFGYVADKPHPRMASTGTEGRCELCGLLDSPMHDEWRRP